MSKSELKIKTRERGCIWRERKGAQGLKRRNDHADDAAEGISYFINRTDLFHLSKSHFLLERRMIKNLQSGEIELIVKNYFL